METNAMKLTQKAVTAIAQAWAAPKVHKPAKRV